MDPYDFNCTHCVQAYELRRRGYDVEASGLPTEYLPGVLGAGGRGLGDLEEAWGVRFTVGSQAEILRAFKGFGPESRGFVAVLWRFGGGHMFNVENVEGTIRFVDPQTADPDVSGYFDLADWSAYARTDDAEPSAGIDFFVVEESA